VGAPDSGDAAELKKRAERLRDCAREARSVAGRLGRYLDDAVKKATPRGDKGAIWQGPYADQCTTALQKRQSSLSRLARSLLADAKRWESEATDLDRKAKDKDKAKAATGGAN
jgi:hypothetical protein